jgi:hypothetical protein
LKVVPDAYELHYDLGLALKLKDDIAGSTPVLLIRPILSAFWKCSRAASTMPWNSSRSL